MYPPLLCLFQLVVTRWRHAVEDNVSGIRRGCQSLLWQAHLSDKTSDGEFNSRIWHLSEGLNGENHSTLSLSLKREAQSLPFKWRTSMDRLPKMRSTCRLSRMWVYPRVTSQSLETLAFRLINSACYGSYIYFSVSKWEASRSSCWLQTTGRAWDTEEWRAVIKRNYLWVKEREKKKHRKHLCF